MYILRGWTPPVLQISPAHFKSSSKTDPLHHAAARLWCDLTGNETSHHSTRLVHILTISACGPSKHWSSFQSALERENIAVQEWRGLRHIDWGCKRWVICQPQNLEEKTLKPWLLSHCACAVDGRLQTGHTFKALKINSEQRPWLNKWFNQDSPGKMEPFNSVII